MKHRLNLLKLSLFSLLATSLQVKAQGYLAEFREIQNPNSQVWIIDVDVKTENKIHYLSAQFKLENEILIEEKAQIKEGTADLIEYRITNHQLGDSGQVTVLADNVELQYTDASGKKHTKELKVKGPLVTPANFDYFIQSQFAELQKNKKISVDFFAWEAKDSVTFVIQYKGLTEVSGEKMHHFKMSLSNFLLAAFFDDIEIWFAEDMKQVRKYKGRVAIKKKNSKSGKLSAIDADVIYKYKNNPTP